MSDLYKVDQIAGKGLGCIATKDIKRGTLILREVAQVSGNNWQLDEKSFSIDKLLMWELIALHHSLLNRKNSFIIIQYPPGTSKYFSEEFEKFEKKEFVETFMGGHRL